MVFVLAAAGLIFAVSTLGISLLITIYAVMKLTHAVRAGGTPVVLEIGALVAALIVTSLLLQAGNDDSGDAKDPTSGELQEYNQAVDEGQAERLDRLKEKLDAAKK